MSAKDEIMRALHSRDGHALKHTHGELSDAILSYLDKAGYAVVPKEPTLEMNNAGYMAKRAGFWSSDIYKAMLTAAKETP